MTTTETSKKPWCPELRKDFDNFDWYPVIAQPKFDGEYEIVEYVNQGNDENATICCTNKYGKERKDFPALDEIKKNLVSSGIIGRIELLAELYWGDGKKGALYDLLANKHSDKLKLFVHDIKLPGLTTGARMEWLTGHGFNPQHAMIMNKEAAVEYFMTHAEAGWEGVVFKPFNAKITDAKQWVKLKLEEESEMRVVKIYDNEEKVDLEFTGPTGTCIVGARLLDNMRKIIKVGDAVIVKHFGFTNTGSVRNPILEGLFINPQEVKDGHHPGRTEPGEGKTGT